jgi:hypothetical protein
MLYQAYQAHSDVMGLVRAFANVTLGALGRPNGSSARAAQPHRRL